LKTLILSLFLGLFLASCTLPQHSPFDPSDTVYKKSSPSSSKARVTFVRNQNNSQIPIITAVSIDNWIVATLAPGEKTTLEVDPGLREVGVKGKSTSFTLKPSREYFFYIELNKEGTQYELHSVLESESDRIHKS